MSFFTLPPLFLVGPRNPTIPTREYQDSGGGGGSYQEFLQPILDENGPSALLSIQEESARNWEEWHS